VKFSIVVSDPPWGNFRDKLTMSSVKRGAAANYSTMTIEQIKNIPISDIVAEDAVLALWVPSSLLADGIEVMNAWNFTLKQSWIWIKVKNSPLKELSQTIVNKNKLNDKISDIKDTLTGFAKDYWYNQLLSFGMGRISRNVHEIALIGTKGNINSKIQNRSERTVFFAPNTKHSRKPEILQDKLDKIFSDPALNRIELFGRRLRNNWVVVGNESPSCLGENIYDSVNRLKNI